MANQAHNNILYILSAVPSCTPDIIGIHFRQSIVFAVKVFSMIHFFHDPRAK